MRKEQFATIQTKRIETLKLAGAVPAYGSFAKKRPGELKVLKPFQDIVGRWDSTLHMLLRIHALRVDLESFFVEFGAGFLKLSEVEWSQVEYLIDIIKPFGRFTQMIGSTRRPTIHYVFDIYDQLFNHLDQAIGRLSKKRMSWKVEMLEGLQAAHTLLRKYYSKTQTSLGLLYGKAALLNPRKKDELFLSESWQDQNEDWAETYWNALKEDYDHSFITNPEISDLRPSTQDQPAYDMPDDLDTILNSNTIEAVSDEFSQYRKRSKLY